MVVKTNGKRNRTAGHGLELLVARLLREAGFPHVVTCRAENRNRDSLGIDLINTDEDNNGRLEYNIQCKNTTDRPQYDQLLSSMPVNKNVYNIVIHKYTKRCGTKFLPRGHYAIMDMNDFIKMAAELQAYRKSNKTI